jgi:hypothetical protein
MTREQWLAEFVVTLRQARTRAGLSYGTAGKNMCMDHPMVIPVRCVNSTCPVAGWSQRCTDSISGAHREHPRMKATPSTTEAI